MSVSVPAWSGLPLHANSPTPRADELALAVVGAPQLLHLAAAAVAAHGSPTREWSLKQIRALVKSAVTKWPGVSVPGREYERKQDPPRLRHSISMELQELVTHLVHVFRRHAVIRHAARALDRDRPGIVTR